MLMTEDDSRKFLDKLISIEVLLMIKQEGDRTEQNDYDKLNNK